MSWEEWGPFGFGKTQYPLTASTAKSLLEDADPAIFWLLDFLSAMLTKHMGARWTAESAAAGLAKLDGNPSVLVGSKVSHDPLPWLPAFQYDFPILGAFRVAAVRKQEDVAPATHDGQPLYSTAHVLFMLPPLTADQANKLLPILHAVQVVAKEKVFVGADPDWQSGALLTEKMGVTSVMFADAEFGTLRGRAQGDQRRENDAKAFYPSAMLRFQIAENRLASTAPIANVPFTGADVGVSVKDSEGEIVIAEVEVNV